MELCSPRYRGNSALLDEMRPSSTALGSYTQGLADVTVSI